MKQKEKKTCILEIAKEIPATPLFAGP